MKKTSRKAIAVIISAAMVFTSFATNVFAAGINDDSGVVMTQKDSDAGVSEQAYCGGTLKYKIESGNYFTDDIGGTEGTADAAYVAIFDATASTPTVVVDKILELSAAEYNLGYWGDYYQFSGGVTPSINFDSEDITLPNGKYYVAVYVELNGTKYIYNNTESDEFVFVNPENYAVEITENTVGEKYEITYTIPEGTTGLVRLYEVPESGALKGLFTEKDLTAGEDQTVEAATAKADQTVKALLKLFTEVDGTTYRVPVKNADSIDTINGTGNTRDAVSKEVTAEYAPVENAPKILTVKGEDVDQELLEVSVDNEAPFEVQLGDAESDAVLPPKVFTFDDAPLTVAEGDKVTISAGDFNGGTVTPGEHTLKVWYEGYGPEDETPMVTTVTMNIIDEVSITVDAAAYSDGKVTGTVAPGTSTVAIYADEACTGTPLAEGTVKAAEGTWEATLDLTPYIGQTLYAQAECSGITKVQNFTVSEPAAPVFVFVTYTPDGGTEEIKAELKDGKFFVGPSTSYVVEVSDGDNTTPVPVKELTAEGTVFAVTDNKATLDTWTKAGDGNNKLTVYYGTADETDAVAAGTAIGEAILVIDSEKPTIEIAAVTDADTTVSATVTDELSTIASVVFTIGDEEYEAAQNAETGAWEATIPAQLVGTVITAVATDSAGNVSDPASTTVGKSEIKDITVTTAEATVGAVPKLVYTVDAEEGRDIVATIAKDGAAPIGLATVAIGDNEVIASETFNPDVNFAEGEYVITVSYADPAYADQAGSVTIKVVPLNPANLGAAENVVDNEVTEITGKATAGTTAYLEIGGTTYQAEVDENGDFTIDITGADLEVGTTYDVNVKDSAGNIAAIPDGYTNHQFTVEAADIAQIELSTDFTLDGDAYYVDGAEAVKGINVTVKAEEGYAVKVTISGDTAFELVETEKTIDEATGEDVVTYEYQAAVVSQGYARPGEFTVSAEYTKAGFEDKAAEDITIIVTEEDALDPQFDEPVTDRSEAITGTTTGLDAAGEEVAQSEVQKVEVKIGDAEWAEATVDNEAGTWSYALTENLTAGDTILARLTNRGGKVSEGTVETTVLYADVIDIELEYDEDDAEGTTASKDGFGFKLTADEGRKVVVKISTTVNGVEVVIDDWNEAVVDGTGEAVSYFAERNASDTELAEGDWIIEAWYEDEEAMQAQIDNTELEDQPIHEGAILRTDLKVTVIGAPGTPELVDPEEVTNRTEEITVKLGDNAKTAKVYTKDGEGEEATLTEITDCTVAKDEESGNWVITLPEATADNYIKAGTVLAITEVDTSDQESEEPLEVEVAYDEAITITITAPEEGDDRIINPAKDKEDIVISGETTAVYEGTTIIVSFVNADDDSFALDDVEATVAEDGTWEATFPYKAATFAGLPEGDYTVTAKVDDERPDVEEDTYTQDEITMTVDASEPGAPVIVGSTIDDEDVDGSVTTRTTAIYGTAKDAAGEEYEPAGETIYIIKAGADDDIDAMVEALKAKIEAGEELTADDYAATTSTTEPEGEEGDGPNWRVDISDLEVGDKVVAMLVDKAGNVSVSDAETVEEAAAQAYALSIDDLENPYVNTADEDSENYQTLTFTGTSSAKDGDMVKVHIDSDKLEAYNDKEVEISGGEWTVTFGGADAVAEEKAAVAALTEGDAKEIEVSVSFASDALTVDEESEDTKTTTSIYTDNVAPEVPTIDNEEVSNRTTVLNVTSNTTYEFAEEEPVADGGKITVYVDGEALELEEGAAVDNGDGTWSITIPEQNAGSEITITETDMAGNESDPSEAVTVIEAKEDPSGEGDEEAGTVDAIVITKINDEENEEGVEEYNVNNNADGTQEVVISGKAANEKVKVSFAAEDGTNADVVFTGEKEWTVEDNTWEVKLNIGKLQNTDPDNTKYIFTITYVNSENSDEEGVVGEAAATIIIDVTAPDAPVIDEPVTDRAEEISGTAEPGSEVTATITDADGNETTLGPVTADEDGNWSIPLVDPETEEPIELEEGDTVEAVATDAAGNESEPAEATVEQATSDSEDLPKLVITGVKVNGTSATISGTKAPGEAATLTIKNDSERTAALDPEAETFEVTFENFADGKYTAVATYDNLGDEPTEKAFTVGSKPSGGGGGGGSSAVNKPIVIENVSNEDQPTISGKGEPNKEIEVFMINTKDPNNTNKTGDSIGKVKTDKNGNWSLEYPADLTPIEPGEYKVTAQYTLGENSYTGRTSAKFTVDPSNTAINNENDLLVVQIDNPKYYLNGKPAVMDSAPFIDENDRTMLPVRVVANALGISDADITWDDETKTATFTRADGVVVSCTVGSNVIKVGDQDMVIDTVPVIRNDRIYLPMRALFNAFNVSDAHIIWDGENRTVTVTKEALDDIAAVTAEAPEGE